MKYTARLKDLDTDGDENNYSGQRVKDICIEAKMRDKNKDRSQINQFK